MGSEDQELLKKIRRHLFDLHTAWSNDPNEDGHHKSNEGYVGLSLAYPNWFEADDYLKDEPEVWQVEVYSYLFGPHRLHEFKSLREAWEAVREWSYTPLPSENSGSSELAQRTIKGN